MAVVALSESIVSSQTGLFPVQAPVQPVKLSPSSSSAVKMTRVPASNRCEQSVPHLIPAGTEVTVPLPGPPFPTPRKKGPSGMGSTWRETLTVCGLFEAAGSEIVMVSL